MSTLFPTEPTNGNMISEWLGDSDSGAVFDETRRYRYSLWRRWGFDECEMFPMPEARNRDAKLRMHISFIGLNPSTADQSINDPTVSRCVRFAKEWGFRSMSMLNLFAFRAADPKVMKADSEPIGGENNGRCIQWFAENSGLVIAAWGNHGSYLGRSKSVKSTLRACGLVHHLGLTKAMEPRHPLYLRSDTQPTLWKGI